MDYKLKLINVNDEKNLLFFVSEETGSIFLYSIISESFSYICPSDNWTEIGFSYGIAPRRIKRKK
jgi:hypothetical protein